MSYGIAAAELRQFVERIERLEEEKKALSDDVRDVYTELAARGFDAKAVRELVRLRKQDPTERQEFEAILDTYKAALGMAQGDLFRDSMKGLGTPTALTDEEREKGVVAAFVGRDGNRMSIGMGKGSRSRKPAAAAAG